MTTTDKIVIHAEPDGISVLRWFAVYAVMLTAAGIWLWVLSSAQAIAWVPPWQWTQFKALLPELPQATKLLAFAICASLGCTFLPLPVNLFVAAAATHTVAVGTGLWDTVLLVGLVGAIASTIANLNDYHLFTWILRIHKVASIRHTRFYDVATRWFEKSPFFLVTVFNILPIPVDVVRMLAATHRYPRVPFAAANFLGRIIRYSIIAYLIYHFELSVETAMLIMLALALAVLLIKILPRFLALKKAPEASCEP
ncbi:MAG: VTT domain-containing protein [bacterium]|nr:VTT domain-containing protein [bacterium]